MLRGAADDYLALRRAAGFKCVDIAELLASFIRFADERQEDHVRADTAVDWARRGTSVSRRQTRLRTLQIFVEHLRAEDRQHEVIPSDVFPGSTPRRRPPRIFSEEEIRHVLRLADTLGPLGSTRALTYRMLIGLLFTTGLRIGEAVRLTFDDVLPDGLLIHDTKFGKSRQIALHPSTTAALEHYLQVRRRLVTDCDRLFVSTRLSPLERRWVLLTFQALCARAGIDGAGGRRRPRLHDLRHSFAVHALVRCGAERDAIDRHMLALSTYLGHGSPSATYWYLEQTPELMRDIAAACDRSASGRTR